MPLGLTPIAPVRGARGFGIATPDAAGVTYVASGLKPSTTATLFGNGTSIATATVNGAGRATWTLSGRPAVGTVITFDGTVTGSGGTVVGGSVPTRIITLPGPGYQDPEFYPTEFLDVIVGANARTGSIEPKGRGGSGRLRDGLLSGYPLNIAGDFDQFEVSGIKTDARNRPSVDGFRNNATSLKRLLIRKSRVEGIVGTSATNHADAIQQTDAASADEIIVEDCTLGTAFQAAIIKFLASGIGCPKVTFRRVNVFDEVALREASGQPLSTAFIFVGQNTRPMEVVFEDVYADWPGTDNYLLSAQGNVNITGSIIRGRPPGGDFCPA